MSKNGKHNVILVRGIPFYPTVRGFRFSNQSGECKSNVRVMGVPVNHVICYTRLFL